jgi:hypothetical protein
MPVVGRLRLVNRLGPARPCTAQARLVPLVEPRKSEGRMRVAMALEPARCMWEREPCMTARVCRAQLSTGSSDSPGLHRPMAAHSERPCKGLAQHCTD